jgi:putative peptidoglycan lipid II flippase
MITRILNTQTKRISLASFILAVAYLMSALLGILRDRLLAGRFGAGDELDIYYAAFRIPDFVAMVMILGAISAAIIPVFSSYFVRSKEEAWKFASALLNVFLAVLVVVSAILAILAPYFVCLIAPGFSGEKREMTILLTRIMFLSPIILGTSNIISGILQVFHRFLATALAPIMYNLGIIFGIVFFVPRIGLQGLAWGVALGGFMHLLIQLPAFYSSGFRYRKIFDLGHPGVIRVIKLMIPRSFGLAAGQINLIAVTAIASTLVSGSIAVFNLANNLSSIVINFIAVSMSTAIFPALSLAFSKDENQDFLNKFSMVFRQILFLTIPLSAVFFMLRAQIVRLILGVGQFGWLDTRLTAACLGIFSIGLFAQSLVFHISKTFYATHNTKTPALISFASVACNIGLSLLFVWLLSFQNMFFVFLQKLFKLEGIDNIAVIGLSLAFSMTAIFQLKLLLIALYYRIGNFRIKEILESFGKIAAAASIMAASVYFIRQILAGVVDMQTFWGILFQTAGAALAGVVVYSAITLILKSPETRVIKNLIFKQIIRQ